MSQDLCYNTYGFVTSTDDVIDIALRQKGEQVLGLLVEAGADLHEKLAPGRTAIDFIREILGNDTAESLCAPTTAEKTEKEQKSTRLIHPVFLSQTPRKEKLAALDDPSEIREITKQLQGL